MLSIWRKSDAKNLLFPVKNDYCTDHQVVNISSGFCLTIQTYEADILKITKIFQM